MGLFSALFGGSSSSSVSTSTTQVDVQVNPEITTVNLVDLQPVQNLVDNLAGAQVQTAEFQARALASLGESLAAGQVESAREVAASQRAAAREVASAQRASTEVQADQTRDLMLLLAGGVSLFALSRAG